MVLRREWADGTNASWLFFRVIFLLGTNFFFLLATQFVFILIFKYIPRRERADGTHASAVVPGAGSARPRGLHEDRPSPAARQVRRTPHADTRTTENLPGNVNN